MSAYFWHCSCGEPVLRYAGPNPAGPTRDSALAHADWCDMNGQPVRAAAPFDNCPECETRLQAHLKYVGPNPPCEAKLLARRTTRK